MKKTTILLLFCISSVFSQIGIDKAIQVAKNTAKNTTKNYQPRWIQTIEGGICLSTDIEVNYSSVFKNSEEYEKNKSLLRPSEKLKSKPAFQITYSINHPVLKRLTLGATSEYQFQTGENLSTLQLGSILRYYFKSYNGPNIYSGISYNVALTHKLRSSMGNFRFGLQIPVDKYIDKKLSLNIFWYSNTYQMSRNELKKIEVEGDYIFKGYGINIGYRF